MPRPCHVVPVSRRGAKRNGTQPRAETANGRDSSVFLHPANRKNPCTVTYRKCTEVAGGEHRNSLHNPVTKPYHPPRGRTPPHRAEETPLSRLGCVPIPLLRRGRLRGRAWTSVDGGRHGTCAPLSFQRRPPTGARRAHPPRTGSSRSVTRHGPLPAGGELIIRGRATAESRSGLSWTVGTAGHRAR